MATSAAGDPRTLTELGLPAALLDALPVGVACIDADLRVVYVNGAGATALGLATGTDLGSADARLAPLTAAAPAITARAAAVSGASLAPADPRSIPVATPSAVAPAPLT